MAPEQTRGEPITPAADVWALGLLTFQLLTGRSYWRAANLPAPTAMQILGEVVGEALECASARAAGYGVAARIPPGFDAWFTRAAVRERSARFPTAGEAWAELAPILGGGGEPRQGFADTAPSGALADTVASQARAPIKRRRAAALPVVAAVALLAIGIAGAVKLRQAGPGNPAAATTPVGLFMVPIDDSPARGGREPLVTVVAFGDFQCPFTRVADEKLRALLAEHPNDLRVVFKHYPLGLHPNALAASRLAVDARAASGDDAFWKFNDALLAGQDHLYGSNATALSKALGLDASVVQAAFADERVPEAVMKDIRLAESLGVVKTPTVFVNGRRHEGSEVAGLVKAELAAAKSRPVSRQGLYERLIADGARGATRPVIQLPTAPPAALERGQRGDRAVEIHYFATYNDFIVILAEPSLARVLARYKDRVHFVFWDIADPGDAEAFEIASAVHASTSNGGWKMHDELLKRQYGPTWTFKRQPFTRDGLRQLAVELGVDAAAYDYELRTQAPNRVRSLWRAAKEAGITERSLFIDGERHLVSAPTAHLELVVERALARRAGN